MNSLKTPLAAALGCIVLVLIRGFYPNLSSLWLILPMASFGLSIRYGNGLTANLFAASILTGFAAYTVDPFDAFPIAILSFGIALTMDYFKRVIAEQAEAETRSRVQLEEFQKSLAEIRELPDISRRQVNSLKMCLEDVEILMRRYPEFVNDLMPSRARIADVISMVAGWRELAREHEDVRKKYSEEDAANVERKT